MRAVWSTLWDPLIFSNPGSRREPSLPQCASIHQFGGAKRSENYRQWTIGVAKGRALLPHIDTDRIIPITSILEQDSIPSTASPTLAQRGSPHSSHASGISNASSLLLSMSQSDLSPAMVDGMPSKTEPLLTQNATKADQRSPKSARRRNKPSLSCQACTVKKTRCDRDRPVCGACNKRASHCVYSDVKEPRTRRRQMGDHEPGRGRQDATSAPLDHTRSGSSGQGASTTSNPASSVSDGHTSHLGSPANELIASAMQVERPSNQSHTLLSSIPFPHTTEANLFSNAHPFTDYWKHHDGLAEVMSAARPRYESASVMMNTFLEKVDSIFPVICHPLFEEEYKKFWEYDTSNSSQQWDEDFAASAALIFVMFALATQLYSLAAPPDRHKTEIAEFYLSASNQALKIYSFFRRTCPHAILAMVFTTYYLMNANHSADAWVSVSVYPLSSPVSEFHQ